MTDPVQTDHNISPLPHSVESWSMEQDAEHLMNDLFANVDVLLEGSGSHLPNQLAHQQTEKLPTVPVKATNVTTTSPVTVKPRRTIRTRTQPSKSQATSRQSSLTWQTQFRAWRTRLWGHFDKVCFGVACLSLGSAIVWYVHQNRPSDRTTTAASDSAISEAEVVALSPEDAQFAQYMLRSLRVIERQPLQTPQRPSQATATPGGAQTDIAVSPQVIERIYIPVYPPSRAPVTQSSSQDLTTPSENAASPSRLPQVPTPDQLTRRSETTVPTFETDPVNEPPLEKPLPTGDYKVVGIIQAGDRTTVLVKEGESIHHRVEPGEEVGNSGWMLVSADASSQIATIRRNGDVRSITNGQSF
ncbi:MAG: hypothetical protein F6J87_00255 [Spirulina sp. SIO3F2]|nr:hypothetical protein [Spirulina sp. SIO3F2]